MKDLLTRGLSVVICGTAPGNRSGRRGKYYAGRGNKFWRTLYEIRLTLTELNPDEYENLLKQKDKIGLTDLVKRRFGNDNIMSKRDFDVKGFKKKIKNYRPKLICFNGKRAAQFVLERRIDDYGLQGEEIYSIPVLVVPNTSTKANRWWNKEPWEELSKIIRRTRV